MNINVVNGGNRLLIKPIVKCVNFAGMSLMDFHVLCHTFHVFFY